MYSLSFRIMRYFVPTLRVIFRSRNRGFDKASKKLTFSYWGSLGALDSKKFSDLRNDVDQAFWTPENFHNVPVAFIDILKEVVNSVEIG